MNVQAAPPPYTPAGGNNTQQGNPPVLGAQLPGTTGGLPSLQGLSASANPMAEQLQSMGRGEDKMLVHMTPDEVNSLRGLAQRFGGDLTTNPATGLPEANFLKKLLPTLLGVGLNFILPGSGGIVGALGGKAATAGLATAAAGTALTGDLNKGLMAGLQAFGGASLAGGLEGALGGAEAAGVTPPPAPTMASGPVGSPIAAPGVGGNLTVPGAVPGMTGTNVPASLFSEAAGQGISLTPGAAQTLASAPPASTGGGFLSQFGKSARGTMSGFAGKAAPVAAGMGVLSALSDATTPKMPGPDDEEGFRYVPVRPLERRTRFQTPEQMRASGGAEFNYFTPSNPEPVPFAEGGAVGSPDQDFNSLVAMYQAQNPGAITASMYPTPSAPAQTPTAPPAGIAPTQQGEVMHNFGRPNTSSSLPPIGGLGNTNMPGFMVPFAEQLIRRSRGQNSEGFGSNLKFSPSTGPEERLGRFSSGGQVNMRDGSFVVDARTVSELGNGSSNAGIEMLSKMGGRPVRGPGDGVSDSVKASIGGVQEARVARDEVIFPPEAVRRIGGGSEKRGTAKLYAMMDKAHKARKKAGRGQDTGLRRGLA